MVPPMVPDKELNQTSMAPKRTVTKTIDTTYLLTPSVCGLNNRVTLEAVDDTDDTGDTPHRLDVYEGRLCAAYSMPHRYRCCY
jgi:hypothetical protein